jgi:hypothetical protein
LGLGNHARKGQHRRDCSHIEKKDVLFHKCSGPRVTE